MTFHWHTQSTYRLTLNAAPAGDRVRVPAVMAGIDCRGVGLTADVQKAFSHDPGGSDG